MAIGAPTDEDRFSDDLRLLDYGFSLYRRSTPVRAGQRLAQPTIRYTDGSLPLRAARDLTVGIRRDQRARVEVRAPQEVQGPIDRGARLGRATVLVDGRPAGTVALRAGRSVPKAGAFDRAREYLEDHLITFAVALFVILMIGVLLYLRRARRNDRGSEAG